MPLILLASHVYTSVPLLSGHGTTLLLKTTYTQQRQQQQGECTYVCVVAVVQQRGRRMNSRLLYTNPDTSTYMRSVAQ